MAQGLLQIAPLVIVQGGFVTTKHPFSMNGSSCHHEDSFIFPVNIQAYGFTAGFDFLYNHIRAGIKSLKVRLDMDFRDRLCR